MALAKRIIPALLCKGPTLYKGTMYNAWRSVGVAKQAAMIHQQRGVDELMVLDIQASPLGREPNYKLVEELSGECFMPISVGGGVRTFDDVQRLMNAGADKVVACTGIMQEPKLLRRIAEHYGSQAIIGVVEYRGNKVTSMCGKQSWDFSPVEWAKRCQSSGAGEILLSCVERDGMMGGMDLEAIKAVSQSVNIPVIAMGGCGTARHALEAIQAGADAVAIGAQFLFTNDTPKSVCQYLADHGVEVRK